MPGEVAEKPRTSDVVVSRRRLLVVLVASTVICMTLPLPWRLASLAFAVGGLVAGVMLLVSMSDVRRRLKAAGKPVPGTGGHVVTALLMGVTTVFLLFGLAEAALYPVIAERDRCLSGAHTTAAADECQTHVEDRIQRIQDRLGNAR